MNYYSQSGQDRFVEAVIGVVSCGLFLDIGCRGKHESNTWGLEEAGWRGWVIDKDPQPEAEARPSRFIQADATVLDYYWIPKHIHYLSLDVDDASLEVLKRLLPVHTLFDVITIEHDAYRLGDALREPQRQLLREAGYELIVANLCDSLPYEDWWVRRNVASRAERFRSSNKGWRELFGL